MVPSSMACLISMSPYPAPSVSTSRMVVNIPARAPVGPRQVARAARANAISRVQNIRVIATLGRVLAPQENMRVRIDQSRQHRGIREINHFSRRRESALTRRPLFRCGRHAQK